MELFLELEKDKVWQVEKRSDIEVITYCTSLAEQSKWLDLIYAADKYIADENVLDIQIVCLYLYAYYNLHSSDEDLLLVLEKLKMVLSDFFDSLTPNNKLKIIILRSVQGFLVNLAGSIEYYQPDINVSIHAKVVSHLKDILELSKDDSVKDTMENSLLKYYSDLIKVIQKYIIENVATENENNESISENCINIESAQKEININIKEFGSIHWKNLLSKVNRFCAVKMDSNNLELALLFDAIQEEIKNFNPIKYFPDEFQEFMKTVDVSTYQRMQETIEASKSSPLWDFMLQKSEVNLQVNQNQSESLFEGENFINTTHNNMGSAQLHDNFSLASSNDQPYPEDHRQANERY